MIKDIILGPIITEKSSFMGVENKYVFKVSYKANKIEIKNAIENYFKVNVLKVRTINVHPKRKRVGKFLGMTNKSKKAIISIHADQRISEFEKLT
jgi:large subunit ribosomal protein L23